MDHAKQIALLEQCLDLTQRKQPFITDNEALIPVDRYTDPARFEVERQRLFSSVPTIVAHASEIPEPGNFVTRDVIGTPAIVVRGTDGHINAFINVCRHRGATVELREKGSCRRFVCPYHAWAYDTDGALALVRHPEGFPSLDIAQTSLVRLPCFEGAGLIWVAPTAASESTTPDPGTQQVIDELNGIGCGDYVVFKKTSRVWNANWKILTEGGLESYHFQIAHRKTIAEFFGDTTSTFEFVGNHVRSVLPRRSILALVDTPKNEWNIRDHTHLTYALCPSSSLLIQKSHYELLGMTPLSPTQTRVEIVTVVPNPGPDGYSDKAHNHWTKNHDFTCRTLSEDFTLGEQIQRGIQSGANKFFRFARFEGALKQWHDWLEQQVYEAPLDPASH